MSASRKEIERITAMSLAGGLAFGIRAVAIAFGLSLPAYKSRPGEPFRIARRGGSAAAAAGPSRQHQDKPLVRRPFRRGHGWLRIDDVMLRATTE
jgi:hypothetical protein